MFKFLEDLESFTKKVIPEGSSEIQIKEMRKAYIAGSKMTMTRIAGNNTEMALDYCEDIDDMFEYITEGQT